MIAGLGEAGSIAGVPELDSEQAVQTAGRVVLTLIEGMLAGLGSATVLIVGIVTGLFILFILLFLMDSFRS